MTLPGLRRRPSVADLMAQVVELQARVAELERAEQPPARPARRVAACAVTRGYVSPHPSLAAR